MNWKKFDRIFVSEMVLKAAGNEEILLMNSQKSFFSSKSSTQDVIFIDWFIEFSGCRAKCRICWTIPVEIK